MVKIPNRLEDLYPAGAVEKILDALQQPEISGRVKDALGKVGIRDVNPLEQVQQAWQQARSWLESLTSEGRATHDPSVINATGELFHPGFSRMPMNSAAAHSFVNAVTSFQLIEVAQAKAAQTAERVLEGADSLLLSSVDVALRGVLSQRHVLVAKYDLLRIAAVGDIGAIIGEERTTEVGAVNGCSKADWEMAIASASPTPVTLLLVSPNGLPKDVAQEQRRIALEVAKSAGVEVVEVLADAVLNRKLAERYGMPLVSEHLEQANVVVAPLDVFLGGPRGAMVATSDGNLDQLRHQSTLRGTMLEASALAAATVAIQMSSLDEIESGAEAALLMNAENLRDRSKRIAIQLNGTHYVQQAREVERVVGLGAAPWDRYQLTNWAIELETNDPQAVLRQLLAATTAGDDDDSGNGPQRSRIMAAEANQRILLDLRFVDPRDDHLLVTALTAQSSGGSPADQENVDENASDPSSGDPNPGNAASGDAASGDTGTADMGTGDSTATPESPEDRQGG